MEKMKLNLLMILAIVCLAASCDDDDDPTTKTFEATFYTDLVSIEADAACDAFAPHVGLNVQAGEGSSTEMDGLTTRISFCVDPNTLKYVNGQGSFVDKATGDEIFFTGSGQVVVPTSEPGYDAEFKDPFEITGGTGKYEGATGSLTTNSFVNFTTNRTDHVWSGTITY